MSVVMVITVAMVSMVSMILKVLFVETPHIHPGTRSVCWPQRAPWLACDSPGTRWYMQCYELSNC
jgi:hypothetical protein